MPLVVQNNVSNNGNTVPQEDPNANLGVGISKTQGTNNTQNAQQTLQTREQSSLTRAEGDKPPSLKFGGGIPPTGDTTTQGSSSVSDAGNPFLTPGSLVAFFMNYMELANTLKQMGFSAAMLKVAEMKMYGDLAEGESQLILEKGKTDAAQHIAAGVAAMVQGFISIATIAVTAKGQKKAEKETSAAKQQKDDRVDSTQKDYAASQTKTNNARQNYDNARTNEASAKKKMDAKSDQLELSKTDKTAEGQKKTEQLQKDFDAAKDDYATAKKDKADAREELDTAKRDEVTAKDNMDDAKRDQAKFNALEFQMSVQQNFTVMYTQTMDALKSFVESAKEFAQANLTLQGSIYEAQRVLVAMQKDLASKGIDQMSEQEKAASDLISQLLQALQKFSDDERKLGGTITSAQGG
jgi:hypothetical protein